MKNLFLVVVALSALAVVGCGGPAEEPMAVTGPKTTEASFVDQMIAKAAGDPSKLSAEERKKMDEVTRGNTDMVLRGGKK